LMSAAATCVCAAIALTFHSGSPHGHSAPRTVSRTATSAIAMQDLLDKPSSTAKRYAWQKSSSSEVEWITSPSGYKFIEEKIGQGVLPARGDVVQIHYTVSLLSSGTTLGTSRGTERPVTMALGKHDVPIWDEAVSGMRVGGQRRMILPPSALPEFQADKVPGENRDLRFDFELLGSVDKATPLAVFASLVPPHRRPTRDSLFRAFATLWLLSFVPYFLPQSMQPEWYHDGKPVEVIRAEQEQRLNSRFLGGDVADLNSLFP